jgi:hypothetical protein
MPAYRHRRTGLSQVGAVEIENAVEREDAVELEDKESMMVEPAGRGYPIRPKGFYPFLDGFLHPELLPAEAAYELTAADRNYQTPYVGITTDGNVRSGLYSLADTGSSSKKAVDAAREYLHTLHPNQRACAVLPMDSPIWRRWTNAFPGWLPKGVQLARMTEGQRDAALGLIQASLSDAGYALVRSAMKLNGALGELVDDYRDTLQEFLYWMTIFGDPNGPDPWGWQLMGHHVDLNCVFVGSQLVFAPVFIGAEPVRADHGTYAGVHALDEETDYGLAVRRALTDEQAGVAVQSASILSADLPAELGGPFNGRHVGGAGADNKVIPYQGIPGGDLSSDQQALLLRLIEMYVNRMPGQHAELKLAQAHDYLDETYFSWRGAHDDVGAFYYRVHSPVILIEYDNHPGIFLDYDEPQRFHIHTIVREPNGNDYGKSLLAQHYAKFHS